MVISKMPTAVSGPPERVSSVRNNEFWFAPASFLQALLGPVFNLQPIPGNSQAKMERDIAQMEADIRRGGYGHMLLGVSKLPLVA